MANKVKFGLKNVHVFPITNTEGNTTTYGKAIAVPGAVTLSLKASGDSNSFYADDTVYFNQFSNNGYEGDLEIALVPEEYELQILGMTKDKNGAIVETNTDKSKNYALAFEIDGDVNQVRHIMYNCASSRPDLEAKTKEDKTDPQTDKLSFSAVPSVEGLIKAKLSKGGTGYDTFFESPYKVVPSEV